MPCWVVPSIAAEFWRVSIEHVLYCIKQGSIQSKSEGGFLFVDVAPGTPVLEKPTEPAPAAEQARPTFTMLSQEELEALESEVEEDDQPSGEFSSWMDKRRQATRSRRAPTLRMAG